MEKKIKVIRPISELQDTKAKIKVCAYCRVSTEQENQNGSYETQKNYYEQYIKSNPEWEFVGIYADKGSGTSTKNRNEFNEMLDDCEDGKIDLIICKSISRFARNTLDAIKIARELKDEGVYIIFEKENINTEKTESELAFNLLASFAQMESESTSKNIKQGVRNRFKNGEYSIGIVPYGYRKKSKNELVIYEKEAEVVRLIFKMYIDGDSPKKIADYLNENKICTKRRWCRTYIPQWIIRNKIYIGTITLQKYVNLQNNKGSVNIGHAPIYELVDEQPAIISKEDFEKANEILNKKRLARGFDNAKKKQLTVFTGNIICGDCGNGLDRTNYQLESYVCHKSWCVKNRVNTNCIKENFIQLRNELVKNYENLLVKNETTEPQAVSKEVVENEQKLNELIKQKEIINRLKEDKIIDSAIFIEKNNKIDTDILSIKEKIYNLNFDNVTKERKRLIKYLKKLSEIKKVEENFQDAEFVNIIDKVYVKGDKVTYVVKTGLKFEYINNYEVFSNAKYGYRKINGKYVINDYEKDIVIYIFDEYISGKSTTDIAKNLSKTGLKTRSGKEIWTRAFIRNCLICKTYSGNDKYPRLVQAEKFNKVQKMLKPNKYGGKKNE